MSHKSQKGKKNPLEMVSCMPSPSPCGILYQETPPSVAAPRKARATGEVWQQPVETPKMADNWDIFEFRVPADPSFPAATSNTSTVNRLEMGQTRKTRRSLEISSENDKTYNMLPVETSPAAIKAPKRSGTLFSASLAEANNKKRKISPSRQLSDNPKPMSLDAKLPLAAAAASKHFEGKPLTAEESSKKSDFTRKQDKEYAKENVNPAAKGNQGLVPVTEKQVNPVGVVEEVPITIMESAARGMLSLSGHDIYYLKQFNDFYKSYQSLNTDISQRLLKLDESNIQKHFENESLKSRLTTMTDKLKLLNEKLSQQKQMTKKYEEKYLDALKERTACKEDYESGLQVVKALLDKKKAELDGNRSEIVALKSELTNMQQTNSGMANDLMELQMKLKQMEETAAKLSDENNKQAAELEKEKLKMQETVADGEVLKLKMSKLESELTAMALERNLLNQRFEEFKELQLVAAETAEQLELSQNDANSLRTLLAEKERTQSSLDERIKALEATQISLLEINEEYAREIDAEKAMFLLELNEKKDAYEDTISNLNSVLSKQLQDLEELAQSHENLKAANDQQLSLHGQELKVWDKHSLQLQEVIKVLENDLQVQAQSLQAEQEKQAKEIQQNRVLTSELEDEKMRHKAGVDALKTVLEQKDMESSTEQKKMQGLAAELEETKKMNSNLKDEKEQIANELSANMTKFTEDLKFQTNSLKNKIFRLQEDLKMKDAKLIGLEHEKNGIIKQLKDKINTICCTIEQPIIASTMAKSPEASKSSIKKSLRKSQHVVKPTVTAVVDNSQSGSSKGRKAQQIHVISDFSDFESEDESMPLKMLFTKRENLAVVQPRTDDLFDTLKKSTTYNM